MSTRPPYVDLSTLTGDEPILIRVLRVDRGRTLYQVLIGTAVFWQRSVTAGGYNKANNEAIAAKRRAEAELANVRERARCALAGEFYWPLR